MTMPHKAAVIERARRAHARCRRARGGELRRRGAGASSIGHNTDGAGLRWTRCGSTRASTSAGRRCVVVGAGGAARAVVRAPRRRGRGRGRRRQPLAGRGRPGGGARRAGRRRVGVGRRRRERRCRDQRHPARDGGRGRPQRATPEPLPVDPELLGAGQVRGRPRLPPGRDPAAAGRPARGVRTVNGLGMLIHQAAHAFRHWTSEDPPLEAMSAAAVAALLHRGQETR